MSATYDIYIESEPNEQSTRANVQAEELQAALASAYAEIRQLIARDTWPRFVLSRFYPQYSTLVTNEEQVSLTVNEFGVVLTDNFQL